MKKKISALLLAGVMVVGNCNPVAASVNTGTTTGSTAAFNATGKVSIDNVKNEVVATGSCSRSCGINVKATFVYNVLAWTEVQTSNTNSVANGTYCTVTASKAGVQAVRGRGDYTFVYGGYSVTIYKEVDAI